MTVAISYAGYPMLSFEGNGGFSNDLDIVSFHSSATILNFNQ